ncbi:hypothetical protein F1D05_33440 [Kribbella qitaiheensis]|uniref:ESX-1 secretion-associated protein n=1 Tax=Kribbella qitaiheensis TaxID=1544730 RepID=A0A7G6X6R1_9ACTN|nr:hypothetical protein [Kribbella qitaiheensis]QNE21926.1 hypothetical protein F1D05_33440 [Kribbella qitaiheensis]
MNDEKLVQYADDAYEAIRALNHGTFRALPAPLAYSVLGNLQAMGFGLAQLTGQLSGGLTESLTAYDVYDNNRDPKVSVAMAAEALRLAAASAQGTAELLAAAQLAINAQGYNVPDTDTDQEDQG